MATAVIGALRVVLGLNAGRFERGLGRAEGRLDRFARRARAASRAVALVGGAAAAASIAIGATMVRGAQTSIDAQAKLARRVGGTTAAIQALNRAGELAGVSQGMLAKATEKINESLGEAARRGIGPAADAIKRLGLNANTLIGLDVDERMAVIADRFDALNLSSAAQADILKDLRVRNKELINLFEGGGNAIRSARAEIRQYGIAVNDIDARKVEMANDAMTKVGLAVKGLANRVAIELAPIIKVVSDKLAGMSKESGGFGPVIAAAVAKVTAALGAFLDGLLEARFDLDEFFAAVVTGSNVILRVAKYFGLSARRSGRSRTASAGCERRGRKAETLAERGAQKGAEGRPGRSREDGRGAGGGGQGTNARR